MARTLVNGNKRNKGYFFTETSTDQNRGFLLRNDDIPPELTFRDLLENIPFFNEESDQAQLDDVSADLYQKAGLVILATDAQATGRITKPSGRSLAAQPSQLTSALTEGNQDINTSKNPLTGADLVKVTRDTGITSRSEYKVGLSTELISWLVAKFDALDSATASNASTITDIVDNQIPAVDNKVDNLEETTTEQFMTALPVGAEMSWPSNTLPSGGQWLFEDGSLLQEADYPELFAVIGITFGTIGPGTFLLPDPRGKMCIPRKSGDPNFNSFNNSGGTKTVTLTALNLPPHRHEAQGNGADIQIVPSGIHEHPIVKSDPSGSGSGDRNRIAGTKNTGNQVATKDNNHAQNAIHQHLNTDFVGQVGNGPGTSSPFSILNPYFVGGNKIIKAKP